MMSMKPQNLAEQALALMRRQGFDAAMAEASEDHVSELNVAHNEPALMRSAQRHKLALFGLIDGRRASTELDDLGDDSLARSVADLYAAARSAPQDAANAVSAGQRANIDQGPANADPVAMADSMIELLDWRARTAPSVTIEEGLVAHHNVNAHTATSGGSSLACRLGWYEIAAMGTARDGERSSSFNHAGGMCNALAGESAQARFGIDTMLSELTRQVHTQPLSQSFVGDVVLTPRAVGSLLAWVRGQLADLALISGTSLYRERVGSPIASPLVGLKSRFDAPGVAALSGDGFVAAPVELLREGRLLTLTPSLYGSRKTGLPHVPLAASGWEMAAGDTPLATVIGGVQRGAIVGRLSMGSPASNGDFSGVVKNSFLIENGAVGAALTEVMVSGNMAQMLRDVLAVSRERLDTGDSLLPWVRIGGLHFS
jgi:PmbA protein